ncbi:uncharacterized protein LOC105696077 [Orussus abietinus]|uniref:uncharacterized protein LOC105696077 n=1 Tax=Orussus abietinus TaxID=222816 RepID=UPI00062695E7|nr:uncharacterized protein LOC105696077 [Orussus abietinus]
MIRSFGFLERIPIIQEPMKTCTMSRSEERSCQKNWKETEQGSEMWFKDTHTVLITPILDLCRALTGQLELITLLRPEQRERFIEEIRRALPEVLLAPVGKETTSRGTLTQFPWRSFPSKELHETVEYVVPAPIQSEETELSTAQEPAPTEKTERLPMTDNLKPIEPLEASFASGDISARNLLSSTMPAEMEAIAARSEPQLEPSQGNSTEQMMLGVRTKMGLVVPFLPPIRDLDSDSEAEPGPFDKDPRRKRRTAALLVSPMAQMLRSVSPAPKTSSTELCRIEETSPVAHPLMGDECWNCLQLGHSYSQCPQPRRRFCYGCGMPGMLRKGCSKCASREARRRRR